ncbi:MAG TPA: ammonia-forming cytochrome c nitrite reductase subunit c552, partial [Bacteroidales bacterium]|nr:ammonia-forming cytochrome c nitrite reductase subunit c552 [Bacteroidales bacterium]
LVRAHVEAKKAWDLGATDDKMEKALKLIRQAQWRWDYAAAGHGNSFHAPVEISRIIASGINKGQEARIELARIMSSLGFNEEVPYPDIATKELAQKFIGLDMSKFKKDKAEFIKTVVPQWIEEAKERESRY